MKKKILAKRIAVAVSFVVALALGAVFPGLPWTARNRHVFKRTLVKARIRLAKLGGASPRLAKITGRLDVPGARVEALDSPSGWASLADAEGRFLVPQETWYPGAELELLVRDRSGTAKIVKAALPAELPPQAVCDLGTVSVREGVSPGDARGANALTFLDFDQGNTEYYRNLFAKLTADKPTDAEKIDALCLFVAAKLNFDEATSEYDSPRQVLERGSKFCGPLSATMATLAHAANYRTRILHLRDGEPSPNFHAVVEVFYDEAWHLHDPTYGIKFLKADGSVASYEDLRLHPELVVPETLVKVDPRTRRNAYAWMPDDSNSVFVFLVQPHNFDGVADWLPGVYRSGIHHVFEFRPK